MVVVSTKCMLRALWVRSEHMGNVVSTQGTVSTHMAVCEYIWHFVITLDVYKHIKMHLNVFSSSLKIFEHV